MPHYLDTENSILLPSPYISHQTGQSIFYSTSLIFVCFKCITDFLKHDNYFTFFYWSIADLQCFVNFCCKVTQLYTYILSFLYAFHNGLSQDIECSSLCYTVGPCCLSVLYIVVCICYSQTPNLSLPPPPLSPLVSIRSFSMSASVSYSLVSQRPLIFSVTFLSLSVHCLEGGWHI